MPFGFDDEPDSPSKPELAENAEATAREAINRADTIVDAVEDEAQNTGEPVDTVMAGLIDASVASYEASGHPQGALADAIDTDAAGLLTVLTGGPESRNTADAVMESPDEVLGGALEVLNTVDPSGEAIEEVTSILKEVAAAESRPGDKPPDGLDAVTEQRSTDKLPQTQSHATPGEYAKDHLPDARVLNKLVPNMDGLPHVQRAAERGREGAGDTLKREKAIVHWLHKIDKLLSRGEAVEARVWESSVKECIIRPENIPDSYWKQMQQSVRDNGGGDVDIGQAEKDKLAAELQDAQRTGLESWSKYLEASGDQYPTWFKLYAWQGMSQLGVFDKQKGGFRKRDASTVAPYPQLNPAALAKLYDAVKDYHVDGVNPRHEIANLVKGGNFNNLYSHFLLEEKAVLPTPERSEDVKGNWKPYTDQDIESLMAAAEGTAWCIAGRNMAEHYTQNGGEFYLFHLSDAETGDECPTACASVRMENGQVAEISGLKEGQALEDSLIPIVYEKASTLPGGEEYLETFRDKVSLMAIDRKLQAGKDFNLEELELIFEVNRGIKPVNKNRYLPDPRPEQFRQHAKTNEAYVRLLEEKYGEATTKLLMEEKRGTSFDWEKWRADGANMDVIVDRLSYQSVYENTTQLLDAGAHVDTIVSRLSDQGIVEKFPQLRLAGASVDSLISRLSPAVLAQSIPQLRAAGVPIESFVVPELPPRDIAEKLSQIRAAGVDVDVDDLASKLSDFEIAAYFPQLHKAGVHIDVNEFIFRVPRDVVELFRSGFLDAGADPALVEARIKEHASKEEQ